MKRTLPLLLLALGGLAACSDGTGGEPLAQLDVEPSTYFLSVGDTFRLTVTGKNDAGTTVSVNGASFKSENPGVASVTGDGKVTGVSVGTTDIIVKAGGQTDTSTINVLAQGSIKTFNVDALSETGCEEPVYHPARQVASAAHVAIYEDLNNPSGGFTAAEYQSIADEFEAKIYPTDIANFGTPTDLDANGKVIILYTRAVNELTPPGAGFIYGGFFYERDLFPRTETSQFQACPTSNLAEMFYLLSVDPTGSINGHVRDKAYVRESTLSTTAHELQHLINHSRRLYVTHAPAETLWLDEGLSHVAEELVYYAESGRSPRQNLGQAQILASQAQLDDFNEFMIQNTVRYREYLRAPAPNSPWANNDELETRGATWSYLRYLADRKGGSEPAFWAALVNSSTTGIGNLNAATGTDATAWARDWAVSNYTDDAGFTTGAQFTQPSWNYRDIFKNSGLGGTYPLQVSTLGAGTTGVSVKAGSAAYLKFGVAAGQQGDIRVAPSGGTVAGACTVLNLNVGDVHQVVMGTGVALCPAGGAAGAEFVVIPFYGSATSDATIGIGVTAANVIAPVGPPNPSRTAESSLVSPFPLDHYGLSRPYDGGLELRLRLRERRIAERLRPSTTSGARRDANAVDGPNGVTVNVVRTK
ncbi:MAG TPA: Ig-like domain-containing protein [Longimicrobium sp.]